ncbi:hypothetical protein ACQP00_27580 [Dactylosporangium sp. CS-047395]|uniref:hypothetical protein n=1 Tax=Dactylosporangium sp. CS-047395 TaxID=3239936 RepID=UPI003D89BE55
MEERCYVQSLPGNRWVQTAFDLDDREAERARTVTFGGGTVADRHSRRPQHGK